MDKVEERKEKIKNWLKNPYNLALVGLLLLAFIIRLYYFFLTKNQPLWWDEAEYLLKAKNIAFGTPDTGWWAAGRPILFPVIASIFFKIGLGEIGLRFFYMLLSIFNILLIFLITKRLFNEKIALISSFLYSFFYIDFFYTFRLLVDLPQISFILLATYLFIEGYLINYKPKYIWFILPVLVIGILLRFTIALFLFILGIFLLITEGFKIFKNKDWWISALLAGLCYIPYWMWSYIKFKSVNPLYTILYVFGTTQVSRAPGDTPFNVFMTYIKYLPNYAGYLLFLIFLIGLSFLILDIGLGFDNIRKNLLLKKQVFVLLSLFIPLIYFGFLVNHFEDRYIFMLFPYFFSIIGFSLEKLKDYITVYHRKLAVIMIVLVILFGSYQMMAHSNSILKIKIDSYKDVKDAGLWIKENSGPSDIIISASTSQNTYYSERSTYSSSPFQNLTSFEANISELKPIFFVVSIFEKIPEWVYTYPQENNLTVVQAYFLDVERTKPSLIIYKFS